MNGQIRRTKFRRRKHEIINLLDCHQLSTNTATVVKLCYIEKTSVYCLVNTVFNCSSLLCQQIYFDKNVNSDKLPPEQSVDFYQ